MSKPLQLKPRVSEKSYAYSEHMNTFIFEVPLGANKHAVKQAIEQQFKVSVTNVNMLRQDGKTKRLFRRGDRKATEGRRSDFKKAFVTLKEGDKLPIFAAVDAGEQASSDSTSTKRSRKESK